jgi:hypothetical protein
MRLPDVYCGETIRDLWWGLSGVYAIQHIETKRVYIGASECIRARLMTHFKQLRKNKSPHPKLQAAWNTLGGEAAFRWRILRIVPIPLSEKWGSVMHYDLRMHEAIFLRRHQKLAAFNTKGGCWL